MCWLILQYPQTGRTSGNCPTLVIPTSFSRSCSTLRRVEPQATYHNRLVSHRLHLLQYPQTGRTSGNILLLPDNTAALRLAVPSDGSNLMQQLQRCHDHPGLRRLAVPSDGSNLMQLATTVSFPCVPPVLQYPLTGRT